MTKIVCHRGGSLTAPENTFAGAEEALRLGGALIELDIRQSRDGVLYVMHDATVDRTTDGEGPIADMTSDQIDRLDAGGWFDPRFAGQRVPRLKDYLARFSDRAGFYLEVKHADCQAIGALVQALDIAPQCFTFSFDEQMRADMWRYAPQVRRMIHWSTAGSAEAARDEHGAEIVEFLPRVFDPDAIRTCQDAGLEVMFFTDKDDREMFIQAIDLKMTYANIDHISSFAALREERAIDV